MEPSKSCNLCHRAKHWFATIGHLREKLKPPWQDVVKDLITEESEDMGLDCEKALGQHLESEPASEVAKDFSAKQLIEIISKEANLRVFNDRIRAQEANENGRCWKQKAQPKSQKWFDRTYAWQKAVSKGIRNLQIILSPEWNDKNWWNMPESCQMLFVRTR